MNKERKVEILVGLFLLIGFGFIAVMVVMFGKVGQGFRDDYEITVEFPNASGIVKDSDVLLSGARIGRVSEPPSPPRLVGRTFVVAMKLRIRSDVLIPKAASIIVGSSGLLGDRYVDVIPPAEFDPADVVQPGTTVQGSRAAGFDDLTIKGGLVMDQLVKQLEQIGVMTASINQRLLNEGNLKNLEETFTNLKSTTANFNDASKKLDGVLLEAQGAVGSAKGTMQTADAAAADLRTAIADLRKVAETANKTIGSAQGLVQSGQTFLTQATKGQGALGTLISNPETAEDLRVFLANLRRSGPIFYKNRPANPAAAPARQESRPAKRR
jgi:phospholipid/cholesterol/gamma-HCH transport system substrate-binding protein